MQGNCETNPEVGGGGKGDWEMELFQGLIFQTPTLLYLEEQ